jgi:uncharacterized DUF497 family protein
LLECASNGIRKKRLATSESTACPLRRACELFTIDAPVLDVYDVEHSMAEDRFKSIGPIRRGLVLVVWTERSDDLVRIISAWWATKAEEQLYTEYLESMR